MPLWAYIGEGSNSLLIPVVSSVILFVCLSVIVRSLAFFSFYALLDPPQTIPQNSTTRPIPDNRRGNFTLNPSKASGHGFLDIRITLNAFRVLSIESLFLLQMKISRLNVMIMRTLGATNSGSFRAS